MRVYDVASIANKDISERIITAPVSPLGQDTHILRRNATCVALPTNQPINPERNAGSNRPTLPKSTSPRSCARTMKSSRCTRSTATPT